MKKNDLLILGGILALATISYSVYNMAMGLKDLEADLLDDDDIENIDLIQTILIPISERESATTREKNMRCKYCLKIGSYAYENETGLEWLCGPCVETQEFIKNLDMEENNEEM